MEKSPQGALADLTSQQKVAFLFATPYTYPQQKENNVVALDVWDRTIAPKLRNIEIKARWILHYSRAVSESVQALTSVPEWESRAVAEVKVARDELADALRQLDEALNSYNQKPKEG